MRIAICEDNPKDRAILTEYYEKYSKSRGFVPKLLEYESAAGLLSDDNAFEACGIIMDIHMNGGPAGVEAARELRQKGYKGAIVFATVSMDFYPEGFEVGALHYLVKPVSYESFVVAMDRILEKINVKEKFITVTSKREALNVPLEHIYYAEANRHKTILHTLAGEVPVNLSFAQAEELLRDDRFLKCYRSCLVNMDHILRIVDHDFLLTSDHLVPITKRQAGQIKAQYMRYLFSSSDKGQ